MKVTIKRVLWAPTVKEGLKSAVRQQHLDEKNILCYPRRCGLPLNVKRQFKCVSATPNFELFYFENPKPEEEVCFLFNFSVSNVKTEPQQSAGIDTAARNRKVGHFNSDNPDKCCFLLRRLIKVKLTARPQTLADVSCCLPSDSAEPVSIINPVCAAAPWGTTTTWL